MKWNIQKAEDMEFSTNDVFYIDSNILFLLHGGFVVEPQKICEASAYSNFIEYLRAIGCHLCVSALNVQEVLHLVERKHFQAYGKKYTDKIRIKEFRRMKEERQKLRAIQMSIFSQINESYEIIPETIYDKDLKGFVDEYHIHYYEPIDYILVNHHLPLRVITADKDFYSDKRINVYTMFPVS